jgi:PP-loop superfamily ATP-utilizing enzyme
MTEKTVSDAVDLSGGNAPLRDADASVAHGTLADSQVEMAETGLRRLGVANARVQHFGELARVIVNSSDIPVVAVEPLRREVVKLVQSAGFSIVALDMTGKTTPAV